MIEKVPLFNILLDVDVSHIGSCATAKENIIDYLSNPHTDGIIGSELLEI